ncbi:nuclease-related domain-containing protein [Virgibacillus siamensis]|uniref:nuclease-related domain-containing protein n=1 Tax=Virgibacillus siamensis TaxID=480071 RepID=UPI001FEA75C9|nr:nuclease-related domain-containing protein [Virgibacillus siamensis]
MALDRRTPKTHPHKQFISQQATNLYSGYKGEKALEYYLQFLPENQFFIFHYLRFLDKYGHFQLDFLLLSAYFHLIIEVKNVYDNMNFDELGQAFRVMGDDVEVFRSPIEQVNMQHNRLKSLYRNHDFPTVPIKKIVVYSRDDMYLRNLANNKVINDTVMHRDHVLPKIENFTEMYQTPYFSEEQLMELSSTLMGAHRPEDFLLMERLRVSQEELIKGVFCPNCGCVPMLWKHGKWHCKSCGCVSKNAHRTTLADYALLSDEYINNRQARQFLLMDSIHTAKRVLQKEASEEIGNRGGRKYKLDIDKLLAKC